MSEETNEYLKSRREAKNTVFVDLFHFPKYRYELFRALHPEMTDVSEEDVKEITLHPVILNHPYNDLGILVKDKLMIFVEAQSTWSINILVRILLYLAMTYQDYINEHRLNVYSTTKIELPIPEFYVIYTGDRQIKKDIITLKEDFFCNTEIGIDLSAKIIYTENEKDIIGQYIIFCHVLDAQVKLYGRTQKAIEETIRICKDKGVLKEYLTGREKEVITMTKTLFDQNKSVELYAEEYARKVAKESEIKGAVEMCQDLGTSFTDTIRMIAKKFGFTPDKSEDQVKTYWKGHIPTA